MEGEQTIKADSRERGTGGIYWRGNRCLVAYYSCGKKKYVNVETEIRRREALGKRINRKDKEAVQRVAEQLLKERLAAKTMNMLPDDSKDAVTVGELFQLKFDDMKKSNCRPRSIIWFEQRWRLRLEKEFGARRAHDLRRADLEGFQSRFYREKIESAPDLSARKRGARENWINQALAVLNTILKHGKAHERIDHVPSFPDNFAGSLEREGTVTKEQFASMIASCDPDEDWLRCFLLMAYLWGYRLNELLSLQVVRVDLESRQVLLPRELTKAKRDRRVPISDAEAILLRRLCDGKQPENFVFTRADGSRVRNIRKRWDRVIKETQSGHYEIGFDGTKKFIPAIVHDLRRTAISTMLLSGITPEVVRKIVGHVDRRMTDRYFRPTTDDLLRQRLAATVLPALPAA